MGAEQSKVTLSPEEATMVQQAAAVTKLNDSMADVMACSDSGELKVNNDQSSSGNESGNESGSDSVSEGSQLLWEDESDAFAHPEFSTQVQC